MVEISVKDQGTKNLEMEEFLIKKAGKFVKDYEFFPNLSSEASKRGGKSPHDALRKVSFNIPMRSEILEFGASRMISTYP